MTGIAEMIGMIWIRDDRDDRHDGDDEDDRHGGDDRNDRTDGDDGMIEITWMVGMTG